MAGVVLETLSTKKLTVLIVSLFLCLVVFFLIGGLIAPAPNSTIISIPIICVDENPHPELVKKGPFIPRNDGDKEVCRHVGTFKDKEIESSRIEANQIVFSQWLPLPRGGHQLNMSRWFQTMLTVIQLDIEYKQDHPIVGKPLMLLDATLWAKNTGDKEWKELHTAKVERRLDCKVDKSLGRPTGTMPSKSPAKTVGESEGTKPGGATAYDSDADLGAGVSPRPDRKPQGLSDTKEIGNTYNCDLMPFFELGSVHYEHYLINVRLPVNPKSEHNANIGEITEMQFITIFQNGGFTKVWFSLKTVLFPMTLSALVWFWHRIMQLSRPANLLERTLFSLGIILSVMNFPIEWVTLWADAPFILLINDIREGAFYAMLLSFWLIFAGEHVMDQVERNKLSAYWKHLLAVIVGCLALFVFDMCERGMQLTNPFYSIWSTTTGTNAALAFIIVAGIAACTYFLFLSYMIFRVFRNITSKATSLSQMSSVRRKFYAGLIFRFKFLMVTTLLCAALTVIFFIISQVSEGHWKWVDEGTSLEYSSAFLTGVYGMWNMYTFALLSLYAPSHKVTATAESLDGTREEEVQLTQIPSESAAFTSVMSKTTID